MTFDVLFPVVSHTRCLNPLCRRPLTDPVSQVRGFGPDCADRLGLAVPRQRLPRPPVPAPDRDEPTLFDTDIPEDTAMPDLTAPTAPQKPEQAGLVSESTPDTPNDPQGRPVVLDRTVAGWLVAHALNSIDPDTACCRHCCAPCAALHALDRAGQLDTVAAAYIDRVGAHEWWDRRTGTVDREWLHQAWQQPTGCHHDATED